MKILEPIKWFPLDHSLIPTLADLGRKRLRYVGPFNKGADGRYSTHLEWDGTLSMTQMSLVQTRIDVQELVVILATILGNGTKKFRMSKEMQDRFEQIEIPMTSAEIAIPFPGCIVELPDGGCHLVAHNREEGVLAMQSTPLPGSTEIDYSFIFPHETIESVFRQKVISDWRHQEHRPLRIALDDFPGHRFRATINFLMWLTMEGVVAERRTVVSNKMPHKFRSAIPRLYQPQKVSLFRSHYESSDAKCVGAGDGSPKRPHWRRMHWRHIPCGQGRSERKLTLIESTFVNKSKFAGEMAGTEYMAV